MSGEKTRPSSTDSVQAAVGVIVLALFIVAPIYALGASLALRTGVFDFTTDAALSAEDARALWGFLGAAVAAGVTATGLMLTYSHNRRSLALRQSVEADKLVAQREAGKRLVLDTAVASLKLINDGNKYSPPATVAGALATLVHLGHPIIALRCLAAAWPDKAVDRATATWLIGTAFETGDDVTKLEAVYLVSDNAEALIVQDRPGSIDLPSFMVGAWPHNIPWPARCEMAKTCLNAVMAKPLSWWRVPGFAVTLLDEAVRCDKDSAVRYSAAGANEILLSAVEDNATFSFGDAKKQARDMKKRAKEAREGALGNVRGVALVEEMLEPLGLWVNQAGSGHPQDH